MILNSKDLELLAYDFRNKNGLTPSEAIRFKSLLLKNNILTVYLPLSNDFSGMAIKINGDTIKRFILVNSNQTRGRQHFTICHEIYHLYYQKDFKSEKSIAGKYDKSYPEEYNADIFASHLLLPENGVRELIPQTERKKNKIKLSTVLSIEQYYSCSRSALLRRLKEMKIIDNNRYDELNVDKIKYARLYGFDVSLYEPGNEGLIIGDYGRLANLLFENGEISESYYFTLLEDIGVDLAKIETNEKDG